MEDYFYLNRHSIEVSEEHKLIKASSYREYIKASELFLIASAKVKKIIDGAKSVYDEQKKKGYNDGLNAGKKDIARIISEVGIEAAIYKDRLENKIVDTIIIILKNILDEIGDEDVLRQIIFKTLKSHKFKKEITIRVCPSQKEIVRNAVKTLQNKIQLVDIIEINGDSSLQKGRCIFQTDFASVDVGIKVQLQMIKALLNEHISRFKKK